MTIYSGFSHWKWWFSIATLNYQRVTHICLLLKSHENSHRKFPINGHTAIYFSLFLLSFLPSNSWDLLLDLLLDLLGLQAISLQTNCHCGPKAASKRKASFPTSRWRERVRRCVKFWKKKMDLEPVDNNELVKNIKIKEKDNNNIYIYDYICVCMCESLYTLYNIYIYIIWGCVKFGYGSAGSDPDVCISLDHLRFGMDREYGSACGFRVWIRALHVDS